MNDPQVRWYRSKVDWWIAVLLWVAPLVSLSVCVRMVLERKFTELPIGIGMLILIAVLYLGVVMPIAYGMHSDHLWIKSGWFRYSIGLSDIVEVKPSRNPLSSPALSLDRLSVRYGTGLFKAVLISPADRDLFLDELAAKAGLRRAGDRLFRSVDN